MKQRERNWYLSPFTTWRIPRGDEFGGTTYEGSPLNPERFDGARITDEDNGLIYEAVIERANGKARLTGITILTTRSGQRIDQATIRRVPVQRIAEQVSLHLAEQESSGTGVFTTGPYRPKPGRPSVEEVAQDRTAGLGRNDIAAKWHVSIYTVDKRLREARDRKLITGPTTGRPRGPKAPSTSQGPPKDTTKRKRDAE